MLARLVGLGDLPGAFRRLWLATLASNLSDGITAITFSLAAVSLTTDPTLVAAVSVAAVLPQVLTALLAGVTADRVDRRRLMASIQILRIAVIGVLVVLTAAGGLSLPLLIVTAFVLGAGQTFYDTTAQAIVPMVAGSAALTRANSRMFGAQMLTDTFLGPPLGGLLVTLGIAVAWAGAGVGYVVALVGLWRLGGTFRVDRMGSTATIREDVAEGLKWLVNHPLQRTLTTMVAMGGFAGSAMFSVFVLYAVAPGPMGLTAVQYGLLLTATGAGSVLGAAVVERIETRLGIARTLVVSQVVFGLTFLVPAVTTDVLAIAIAFFVSGVTIMTWSVTNVSLRQRFIPARLYGRVLAGHRLVTIGSSLAGGVFGGLVAGAIGLPAVFATAGVVAILSSLGGVVVNDRNVVAALAAAGDHGSRQAGRRSA